MEKDIKGLRVGFIGLHFELCDTIEECEATFQQPSVLEGIPRSTFPFWRTVLTQNGIPNGIPTRTEHGNGIPK